MVNTYKGAIVHGEGDIRLEDLEQQEVKDKEVLIEVYKANICPTDLRGYRGVKPLDKPERVGHEFAGVIKAIGEEVSNFKVGDRVTALSWTPCFVCQKCVSGKYSACPHRKMNMGGFGEYITLNENVVYHIPNNLPFQVASYAEPLGSVLKANIEITPVNTGDTVIVYGLGPMGQLHTQVASLMGATKVIGIDLIQSRLDIAQELGADYTINPGETDPVAQVEEITNGEGADIIMVAVGGAAEAPCAETAMDMAAHGGKINIFTGTYPSKNINIDPNLVHYKELNVTGTRSYNLKTFQLALDLLSSGKINVEPISQPKINLDDIKKGFEIHGTKEAMKVAVTIKE